MEKLTAKQIIKKLKTINDSVYHWAYGDEFPEELGETEEVYSKGGEGEGEDWRRVYKFNDHDCYIEIKGHYSSYNGTDFYDSFEKHITEVKPVQKMVTFYE